MFKSLFTQIRAIVAIVVTMLIVAACGGGSTVDGQPVVASASASAKDSLSNLPSADASAKFGSRLPCSRSGMLMGRMGGTSSSQSSCGTVPSTGTSAGAGMGVITGFGSVIVDGMRYNDGAITYMSEQGQGIGMTMASTSATVGQSVEFTHDGNGNMMSAMISPELVGAVSAVAAKSMTVLGTSVGINSDATAGPVTRFVGYASFANVQVGDRVEVHGLLKTDNQGITSVQATLVVKLPAGTGVRLTGYVSQYSASAGTFSIGAETVKVASATILPAGATLSNGELVTIWSNADPVGTTITANTIRVKSISGTALTVTVSGAISNFTSAANFQVRNLTVDASKAVITPSGTALAAGQYVVVAGTFDAASNKLTATSVTVSTAAAPLSVELHGTIANFVSASSFTVRGVTVDASAATITGGTASQLANGVFVEVHGAIANNIVKAATIAIQALDPLHAPMGSMIDVSGMISSYDPSNGSYSMTLASGATMFGTMGSSGFFMNGSAVNLTAGQSVNVTGMLTGGMLSTSVMNFTQGSGASGANSIHMEGIAYNVTSTSFMLNGMLIQTNGAVVQGGGMMGSHSMMSGSHVAVDMQFSGGQYMATSIVLQNS